MIRHAIFFRGSPDFCLAQSVGALAIPMIEPAFEAALMPAAGLASLCDTRSEATGMAAIAMPPVTMGTDKEHGAAIGCHAELLVEDEVVRRCHAGLDGDWWTEVPSDGNIALLIRSVASVSRRLKVNPGC
jgi:hypothetical protein